jgi:UDP-N-acetylmuramoyl-L-alanyl-D-glutamate--2,6-diaminopimelate ligase
MTELAGEPAASSSATSLIFALRKATAYGPLAGRIGAICQDSRHVTPGAAFVAVPGDRTDGHAYLADAVASGAGMLVVQANRRRHWEPLLHSGISVVAVPDTRDALGRLAAAFYDYPARQLTVVGVTGTNGKTSTAFLTAGVLAAGGQTTALLTTAGSAIGDRFVPNECHLTTPDVVGVHRFLARARDAGASCAVIESTSHGLDQLRLAQVDFDVAVLTNLADDHLDYHGSPEAYLRAKARLFEMLDTSYGKGIDKAAVLNGDDPAATALAARTAARRLSYRIGGRADLYAREVSHQGWRTSYRLHAGGRSATVRLNLPGLFNVSNSLAAAAVGVALGLDLDQIRRGLASVTQVPGRMERIAVDRGVSVVVDYAHNGHGLSAALSFLRTTTHGRLIAVFGCAGDRDPSRRPEMARVSARLADYTIVTSDDSWHEDPESIIDEVVSGLIETGKRPDRDYAVRPDRREAIDLALSMAEAGDTVLVAGMGHEQSMMVAGRALPWDDRLVIRELLARHDRLSCAPGTELGHRVVFAGEGCAEPLLLGAAPFGPGREIRGELVPPAAEQEPGERERHQ